MTGPNKTLGKRLQAIEHFYFQDNQGEPVLEDHPTQQATWDLIRGTCHFQNLSVDTLAYVYENTLVTQKTRKAYPESTEGKRGRWSDGGMRDQGSGWRRPDADKMDDVGGGCRAKGS